MTAEPIAHPLEPLTAPEFRATAAILRRDQAVGESWRFASIELIEPAKAEVVAWRAGDSVPRRSLSVLWDRRSNQTYEAVVDLVADRVESWTYVPDVTPNFTVDEFHEVDDALQKLLNGGFDEPEDAEATGEETGESGETGDSGEESGEAGTDDAPRNGGDPKS